MSAALVALHDWGVGKPSWSPDGALIAFDEPFAYGDGATAGIFAMSADGTSHRGADAAWSPDGTRLAFVRLEPR
jgi:Tol biopolymer transport system component